MTFELFNLSLYRHYISFELFKIEIGLGQWIGHFLFFEMHDGDIQWDILFLNGDKPDAVG